MEPKWGLWQHTRFLRTKMWASNVGGGACLASFAISQQPLPWPAARYPPPPAGTAKRIRIKRETCFSLASCSGPMTSPLQPPAPRFQPPSTFFPFAVDPPFYLNSTILYLYQSRVFKMPNFCFHVCFCAHFSALHVHPGNNINPFRKINNKFLSKQERAVTDGCFDIIFQLSKLRLRAAQSCGWE